MGFLWYFYDVSMGFLWDSYGIPMEFLLEFHDASTSSTVQGGSGNFKNRKPIIDLQEPLVVVNHGWQSEATDGPKISYLSLFFSGYLPAYLSIYVSIYVSIYLSIYLPIFLSIYRSIYLYIYISLSLSSNDS